MLEPARSPPFHHQSCCCFAKHIPVPYYAPLIQPAARHAPPSTLPRLRHLHLPLRPHLRLSRRRRRPVPSESDHAHQRTMCASRAGCPSPRAGRRPWPPPRLSEVSSTRLSLSPLAAPQELELTYFCFLHAAYSPYNSRAATPRARGLPPLHSLPLALLRHPRHGRATASDGTFSTSSRAIEHLRSSPSVCYSCQARQVLLEVDHRRRGLPSPRASDLQSGVPASSCGRSTLYDRDSPATGDGWTDGQEARSCTPDAESPASVPPRSHPWPASPGFLARATAFRPP